MSEETPKVNPTTEAQQTIGQSTQTLTTEGVSETWVKEQIATAKKEVIGCI